MNFIILFIDHKLVIIKQYQCLLLISFKHLGKYLYDISHIQLART